MSSRRLWSTVPEIDSNVDGMTAVHIASGRGLTEIVAMLKEGGASSEMTWRGWRPSDMAKRMRRSTVQRTLHSYESHFTGLVCKERGRKINCVASWPGVYARSWDKLVSLAKQQAQEQAQQLHGHGNGAGTDAGAGLAAAVVGKTFSAAVVFLPEHTANFGKHGSECYCVAMYGEVSKAHQIHPKKLLTR